MKMQGAVGARGVAYLSLATRKKAGNDFEPLPAQHGRQFGHFAPARTVSVRIGRDLCDQQERAFRFVPRIAILNQQIGRLQERDIVVRRFRHTQFLQGVVPEIFIRRFFACPAIVPQPLGTRQRQTGHGFFA